MADYNTEQVEKRGNDMSALKRLTKAYHAAHTIRIDDTSKIVLMSDCHRGDGSWADNLAQNENIYYAALNEYFNNGFTYIELGDGDELWEQSNLYLIAEAHKDTFQLLQRFYRQKRLYMLYGNHDMDKRSLCRHLNRCVKQNLPLFENLQPHESLVLEYSQTANRILLIHGHQADFFNDRLWKLARFLVRYLWRPLEAFGFKDPTSPAKNNKRKSSVEATLSKWAQKEKHMLIAGHTHRPVFPDIGLPLYFNDGSCVHPRCITAIEILGGSIALVKWRIATTKESILYVKKDIMAGPEKIEYLFSAIE